jgi:tryptophan synthase alpha chain
MSDHPIRAAFAKAKVEGRAAFIPYIMLGYPDAATSIELAVSLAESGADILELGVPFSDPLADGATIQHASQRSLKNGTTFASCLELAHHINERINIPLIFMGYYNPFLHYGLERACRDSAAAGVSGLIIPDVPIEEADILIDAGQPYGVTPIFLVTPTSPESRIDKVASISRSANSGFIYCVSLSGVTGARASLSTDLPAMIAHIRSYSGDIPLGVGFGIAQPEHAATIAKLADGVVVASALINAYDHASAGEGLKTLSTLARALQKAARI